MTLLQSTAVHRCKSKPELPFTQTHLPSAPLRWRTKVIALAALPISRVTTNCRTSSLIYPLIVAQTRLTEEWNATLMLTRLQMKRKSQPSKGKLLSFSWECEISEMRLFSLGCAQSTAVLNNPITNIVINHISFSGDRIWLGGWWMKYLIDRFHCRGGRVSLVLLGVNVQRFQLYVLLDLLQQRLRV